MEQTAAERHQQQAAAYQSSLSYAILLATTAAQDGRVNWTPLTRIAMESELLAIAANVLRGQDKTATTK